MNQYTYTYNHVGYTVYENGVPVHSASVLNKRKRYNKNDAADNKQAAESHIRLLIAMDKMEVQQNDSI